MSSSKGISKVISYIHFSDDCASAMQFYQQCFGGELFLMKVADSPMASEMPGMEHMVMHASLTTSDWAIFASDWCTTSERKPGNTSSIYLECESESELERLFNALGEGGKVQMPVSDTFWGAKFGMVQDRFGIDWMLSKDNNQG